MISFVAIIRIDPTILFKIKNGTLTHFTFNNIFLNGSHQMTNKKAIIYKTLYIY